MSDAQEMYRSFVKFTMARPSPRSRGDFDAGLDLVEFGQRRGGKMQAAGGWVFFAQGLRRLCKNLFALFYARQKRDEQLLCRGKARDQIRQDGVNGVGGFGHEIRPQISAVEMFAGYQSWISMGLRTNSGDESSGAAASSVLGSDQGVWERLAQVPWPSASRGLCARAIKSIGHFPGSLSLRRS